MKIFKLASIIIACIVIVSGCGINSVDSDEMALPSEDNATEITIEVMDFSTNFFINAAKKFEEETGVKVNVINDYDGNLTDEMLETTQDRILAELMTGKGADIYAGFMLDFNKIGENDHLCNIAGWISRDPIFTQDDYYMGILKSEMDEDKLYSLPLFMMFTALGSNVEVTELDTHESLSWEAFFDRTKDIKRSGVLYAITDYEVFMRRYRDRAEGLIDEKNKSQNLNSSEIVELLEQCKEWSTEGLCIKFNAEDRNTIYENAFFKEYGGDIALLTNIRFDSPYMEGEPYLYEMPSDSAENNKANKISATDLICINAASKYKGTAWKFVKFLLSDDMQSTGFNMPVNRKAAEKDVSKKLAETIEYSKLDINPDEAIKETMDILNSVDKVRDVYPTPIERIVFKEAQRYFSNEISGEEAAKNMADGVELYFKEQ
jgi:multiple sugar transport system substrate-binding protein